MLKSFAAYLAGIVIPPLAQAVRDEVTAQTPVIIKAVAVAMAETAGHLAEDAVDKVTDAIPGKLDDDILDGIVSNVLGKLGIKL